MAFAHDIIQEIPIEANVRFWPISAVRA